MNHTCRSQRCLEDWQKETRDKQRRHQVTVNAGGYNIMPHDLSAAKAPFATDQQQEDDFSQSGLAFVAMNDQRKAILYNLRRTSGSSSTSSLRLVHLIFLEHTATIPNLCLFSDADCKGVSRHLREGCVLITLPALRDEREQRLGERVQQYQKQLQDQRKQVGLISDPSPELVEAERKLAEVSNQA